MWMRLGRPIFTPCALTIDPALSGGHEAVLHQIAAERAAGRSGRGIFVRAHHAAVARWRRRRPGSVEKMKRPRRVIFAASNIAAAARMSTTA